MKFLFPSRDYHREIIAQVLFLNLNSTFYLIKALFSKKGRKYSLSPKFFRYPFFWE